MAKRPDSVAPPYLPWRWDLDEPGTAAIKALDRGDATPEQQRLALTTIIEGIAGYYDLSYRPGDDGRRDTDFAEGRRHVGAQLVKITKLNVNAIKNPRTPQEGSKK